MKTLQTFLAAYDGQPMRVKAEAVGVSRPFLYDLIKGRRQPELAVAVHIEKTTGGEVPVASWPRFAEVAKALGAS